MFLTGLMQGDYNKGRLQMWDKVRKVLYEICEIMELIMAAAVVCGLIVATLALWPELILYWNNRMETGAFLQFLDAIFNVVIGIEFMKMLCKPSSANIIEVLIFLIARHMIIQTTTAREDLLAVVSIGILFLFRRFMMATKPDKNQHIPNVFEAIKINQPGKMQNVDRSAQEEIIPAKKETD